MSQTPRAHEAVVEELPGVPLDPHANAETTDAVGDADPATEPESHTEPKPGEADSLAEPKPGEADSHADVTQPVEADPHADATQPAEADSDADATQPVEAPPSAGPSVAQAEGQSVDARIARLHLKTGLLALARAELETMAGDGALDIAAMADLAEARWRSGDLAGAGEAAQAHIDAGGDELVALVVAVESLSAHGRAADARRVAQRVLERGLDRLDAIYAGEPRTRAWPSVAPAAEPPVESAAAPFLASQAVPPPGPIIAPTPSAAGSPERTRAPAEPAGAAAERPGPEPVVVPPVAAPAAAIHEPRDDLEQAEMLVEAGDLAGAAARLALLLRLRAGLAPAVLELVDRALQVAPDDGVEASALHLVRGDAYRLLGREREAAEAFEATRHALGRAAADQRGSR